MLLDAHAPQQGPLLLLRQVHPQAAGEDQLIVQQPVQGLGRGPSRQAVVDGGGQAVHVRPRALPLVLILLNGGEAVLQGDGHGLVPLGGLPGAAEVQQPHRAPLQHQVVRANIPVDQARLVHGLQGGKEGFDHVQQLAGGDAPAPLGHQLLEGGAVHVLHDDVSGAVGLKKVPHADDLRLFVHLGHGPGLVDEAVLPLLIAPCGAGIAVHRQGYLGVAGHPVGGEVLLDGHLEFQPQVAADIGDAEAALPQHSAYQVTLHEHGARRQVVGQGGVGPKGEAAAGAGLVTRHRRHTVGAIVSIHRLHLPEKDVVSLYGFLPALAIGNYATVPMAQT